MIWICATCAVETGDLPEPPESCAICEDERQWVPAAGQQWTTLEKLRADGTRVTTTEVEPGLWGLRAEPEVGIGQQTMLVVTPSGTLLFDCVGYVDEATVEFVRGFGPTLAVASSHPHMYGVQTSWAAALDAPVVLAARDREWVRRDERVEWFDDVHEVADGLRLHRVGGHFPGQTVVEWEAGAEGRGVLLAGDAIFTNPDRKTVSFLRSYPNRLPLSGAVVLRIADQVERLRFDRLYNNFGAVVPAEAKAIVRYSAERHAAWVRGDYDHLT